MSDSLSPRLGLPFLASQQAQKHVVLNEALARLDALAQLSLESRKLAKAPDNPPEGACYLVAANPDGAWAGRTGEIARFEAGGWIFITPVPGLLAWLRDEAILIVNADAGWIQINGGGKSAAAPVRIISASVDFGPDGARTARAVIKDAAALPGQRISISPSLAMPDGVSADELEMDMLAAAARVNAAGEIEIIAASLGAPLSGARPFTLIIEQGAV